MRGVETISGDSCKVKRAIAGVDCEREERREHPHVPGVTD